MKPSALNTIKYLSYSLFVSLSASHFVVAQSVSQGEQIQEKIHQQEKSYHSQQQKLMALDDKQDTLQEKQSQRENELRQKEQKRLSQEKNAYLSTVADQEADELAEKAALEAMSQPEMETAYEKEQKFKQYDDRLEMQGSY